MIFVDSGAFIAKFFKDDMDHKQAVSQWNEFEESGEKLFTSNLVLTETITYLGRKADFRFAAERARNIYDSLSFQILRPTEEVELLAITLMRKYSDQKIGFADCLSFVLMKREKISRVFTFDRHFQTAGFTVVP